MKKKKKNRLKPCSLNPQKDVYNSTSETFVKVLGKALGVLEAPVKAD